MLIQQTAALWNEILLAVLAFAVFSVRLIFPRRDDGRWEAGMTAGGLLVLLGLSFVSWNLPDTIFGGAYSNGSTQVFFKQMFLMAGLLVTLLSWPDRRKTAAIQPAGQAGEYLGLLLLSLTGMCLLVSAEELVLIYVSLELVTMPLILLVAFNREDRKSLEAGMKYVFFSALSSGLLLYGLSLVYGMTGTTYIREILGRMTLTPLSLAALILVMGGVGFKIAAVPFHLWTPDTYQGAPSPVTAFLSVASKAAGFVLFYKLVAAGFLGLELSVQYLLCLLATVTMTFGNFIALHQTNMKRFLAYSSIAQAGYLMIGLTHPGHLGLVSVTYYILVYLASNLAAFGVVICIERANGRDDMRDYVGLSQTNPGLAAVMMLAMFSLAGIPPLAGFLGKFYLFAAAAEEGLYWLVFVGTINATISLYYYLVVIKWMYIVKPAEGRAGIGRIPLGWPSGTVLFVTTALMLVAGILPQFIHWVETATLPGWG